MPVLTLMSPMLPAASRPYFTLSVNTHLWQQPAPQPSLVLDLLDERLQAINPVCVVSRHSIAQHDTAKSCEAQRCEQTAHGCQQQSTTTVNTGLLLIMWSMVRGKLALQK